METQQTQHTQEQGMQPEVRGTVVEGFSIVLELKPERIQDPLAAQEGAMFAYRISLTGSTAQPFIFELGEPKVAIQMFGESATVA